MINFATDNRYRAMIDSLTDALECATLLYHDTHDNTIRLIREDILSCLTTLI